MSRAVECYGWSAQFDSHNQGWSLVHDESSGMVGLFLPFQCLSSSQEPSKATWILLENFFSSSLRRKIHQRVGFALHWTSIERDNAGGWHQVRNDNKASRCASEAVLISKQRCLFRPWPLPWTLHHNVSVEWSQHDLQSFVLLVPFAEYYWSSQLHLSTNNLASRAAHYRFRWFLWSQSVEWHLRNHFSTRVSSPVGKTSSSNAHDFRARNPSP